MTYKHIEASREARLWVTQVIAPAVIATTVVLASNPELKEKVVTKLRDVKSKIKNTLHK